MYSVTVFIYKTNRLRLGLDRFDARYIFYTKYIMRITFGFNFNFFSR